MMEHEKESIRAKLTQGASVHRIAARIIEQKRGTFLLWKSSAAALLALLFKIPLRDAKAVISEMSVDN